MEEDYKNNTDKELELLIVKQLENLIQQQEAINLLESQQAIINTAITQQKDLNIISDDVIKDLEKSNKELKANTPTPTQNVDYNKIQQIVKENTPTPTQTAKEVYNELFVNNVKNTKDKIIDNDDYLRDLQLAKQQAKATAKAKK